MSKLKTAILILAFFSATLFISQNVNASPQLTTEIMEYEPTPAQAGQYFDVWFKVENIASDANDMAENVTCEIRPKYPFTIDDNQPLSSFRTEDKTKRNVGILEPQSQKTFQYRLRVDSDAVHGWNAIEFSCQSDDHDYWITDEHLIKVAEGVNLRVGKISSDPLELKRDTDEVKLNVQIENVGGADAKNVKAELELPEGFERSYSYSLDDNLGRIDEGNAQEAEFYVDVADDVQAGTHQANLDLEYVSDADSQTIEKTKDVDLNVIDDPDFEVKDVETRPEELRQGDDAELRFTITNHGEKAESTDVRIFKETTQPFSLTENYDYIGDIDTGEELEAVFDIDVEDDADLKNYHLSAEIRHVDGNDVKTTEKNIPVEVIHEARSDLITSLYVLVPLVAIILVAYWKHKKE